jgi:REP element-mobilizing transposase RayT
MPRFAHLWRHVIINTLNTWLHGDERGCRSREPEIRSSGDYRHRPHPEEYRKLREYFEEVAGDEVRFEKELRPIIGRAILNHLREQGFKVLAIAVGKVHTHVIVELPRERAKVKWIIGQAKRKASRAVKKSLPGSVWAAGGEYKIVKDKDHLINAVEYVIYEQGPGTWTWWYRDGDEDGMFGRVRAVPRRSRRK